MRPALSPLLLLAAACATSARPTASPSPAAKPAAAVSPVTPPPPADTLDPLGREAAAIVDRQHEAYNRHDVEGFLAVYADSVAIQTLGDTVALTGKDRLRRSTEAWFADAPDARTTVVERMVLGPFVVDRQRVSGGSAGTPLDAIGIYEVRGGLIRRVWSVPPPPTTK